ncbi:MAG: hypothetical protein MZW92_39765 [Comamonadaceae bacterium]|nr:hypothetical protein [Comamonadaceae bacterium]
MPDPSERANARGFPPAKFATTENAIPARDLARSLAMETAAKIDAIESEMARDFLRPAAEHRQPRHGADHRRPQASQAGGRRVGRAAGRRTRRARSGQRLLPRQHQRDRRQHVGRGLDHRRDRDPVRQRAG